MVFQLILICLLTLAVAAGAYSLAEWLAARWIGSAIPPSVRPAAKPRRGS
jgi:hypothetical protein